MRHFEIWTEGYRVLTSDGAILTEMKPHFKGLVFAHSWHGAMRVVGDKYEVHEKDGQYFLWPGGPRIFDNEADARKSFG